MEQDIKVSVIMTVYHQQNQYAGCARNLGLQYARGKYVIFWDSDDFYDLRALELLYQMCEEDQVELTELKKENKC